MKNVIVLSCNTGQGHNSCAEAIKEYLEGKGIKCGIRDALDFISTGFDRFVTWGHTFMYLHVPGFFGWGYSFNERHPRLLEKGSPTYKVLTSGEKRMYDFLLEGGYDTVICTHVFPAITLTALMERHPLPVRTALVATDYTCHPGTESTDLEKYFIPCEPLADSFRSCLKAPERVVPSGIPVREEFWTRRDRAEAKRYLHIGAESRHLLMMCGSMGCGPIVRLLGRLARELPDSTEVTVICGTNQRLYKKLSGRYKNNRRIHIVGYTEEVSVYMDSADLYLTKPGGISVTEAAAKELPMVFIDAVSGCEKYNMEFFTKMGAAVTDTSVRRLAGKCVALLASEEELSRMRLALREYAQPNGAERIYNELR